MDPPLSSLHLLIRGQALQIISSQFLHYGAKIFLNFHSILLQWLSSKSHQDHIRKMTFKRSYI